MISCLSDAIVVCFDLILNESASLFDESIREISFNDKQNYSFVKQAEKLKSREMLEE